MTETNGYAVTGTVLDIDGNALDNVPVFLRVEDGLLLADVTHDGGVYEFSVDKAGGHHIFFMREHYDSENNITYDLLTEFRRRTTLSTEARDYAVSDTYYIQREVKPTPPPVITVSPDTLQVTLEPGETAIQTLTIANEGDADLTWALTEDPVVNWLAETPTDGTLTPSSRQYVKIIFCATGLKDGDYTTTLQINSNDPHQPQVDVLVTLKVEIPPSEPEIWVSPDTLEVTLAPDEAATELLTIGNEGRADLDWEIDELLGPVWIRTEPTGGTVAFAGSEAVTVEFNATGLAVETYETTLQIHSNDLHQPQVDVLVILTVKEKPITVSPDTLQVTLEPGKTAIQKLTIANEGDADLTWALAEDPVVNWLEETPEGGMLSAGRSQDVEVTFKAPPILAAKTCETTLQITGKGPDELFVEVPVTLTVTLPIDPKKLLDSVTQIQTALEKALDVPYLDSDRHFKGQIAAQHRHVSRFLEKQPETPDIASIKTGIKESSLPAVPRRVESFIDMAESRATNPPAGSKVRYQDLKAKLEAAMPAVSELDTALKSLAS